MIANKIGIYYRLRQQHPDMSPSDAMDLAAQQVADAEAPPAELESSVSKFSPPKTPEVPAAGGMQPDELEPYQAPPAAPPVVQASGRAEPKAPPAIDEAANAAELEAAQESDRQSHFGAGMELAGRQLVAGLTRTSVPDKGVGARADTAPGVLAGQAAKKKTLADYLAAQRQQGLDDSTKSLQESEVIKNLREKPVDPMNDAYRAFLMSKGGKEVELREEDINRKMSDSKAKTDAAAAKEGRRVVGAAQAAEGAKIPFAGGMFQPRAGVHVDKAIAKEASDKAALYSAAIAGIDDFSGALGEYAKHPSPAARDAVIAKANGVGGALNTAQGQGAMSQDETKKMATTLGVDVLSPAGVEAFAQSLLGDDKAAAAQTITRRAQAARQSMVEMAKGSMKARNYDYAPGAGAAAPGQAAKPKMVKVIQTPAGQIVEADNGKRYTAENWKKLNAQP